MNNNVEILTHSNELFGEVRFIKMNGKEYAVGKDVAVALGYVNPTKAISTHCKGVSKMGIPSKGGVQTMSVIPEGDIYRLIIKSKLSQAEKFESWVMDEVLPQIRQTGGYIQVSEEDSEEDLLARALIVAQKTIERKNQKLKEAHKKLEIQEPMVERYKQFLDENGLCTVTDVAKMINVPRNEIFEHLRKHDLVFKKQTKPTKLGVDLGYFKIIVKNGYATMKVTATGIDYIADCFCVRYNNKII